MPLAGCSWDNLFGEEAEGETPPEVEGAAEGE